MKEEKKYLPLGSIVILRGGVQKIVLIARGMVVRVGEEPMYFDYGGCLYPQGLVSEHIMYFNKEDIQKVVFEGYHDDDDNLMSANICEWYDKSGFQKGDTQKLKAQQPGERHVK